MKLSLFALLLLFASCSFHQYKKVSFISTSGPAIQILVPKKWSKVINTPDGAGGMEKVYTYSSGATFYVSNSLKPINPSEIIDTVQHLPLLHSSGARMYKGVMPGLLYWREVQKDAYRIGYRNVPTELENRFDSAVNFSVGMKGL
jgi:hypothetical protein